MKAKQPRLRRALQPLLIELDQTFETHAAYTAQLADQAQLHGVDRVAELGGHVA